ncbi:ABC transporter permease [uncultured Arcticibacterium sp.]|uniref:ABC transporter permease n=1 Tax=uncultured Arcticibacterium sp. TaxID=2173042 RepID=UPI0030FB3476
MIKNYFKIAWRNIIRNKVFSSINILGLSLGLTVVMLITLYVKDELSYDRFHVQGPRIYRVVNDWYNPDGSKGGTDSNSGNPQGPMFQANVPGIKDYVRVKGEYRDVKQKNEVNGYEMLSADASFFSVFSFPLVYGDANTALKEPKSIVLSEEKALQFFGKKNAINETIEIKDGDDFQVYTVTGITKKSPQNSSIKFDMLMPYIVNSKDQSEQWFNYFLNTFVLLDENSNKAEVEASMGTYYEKETALAFKEMQEMYGEEGKTEYLLQPLREMHLSTDYLAQNGLKDNSNPVLSYLLSGIAIFLLVIACINFVNLTISQSLKRAKEIGLRKVVGGDKKQLIYQFLGESYLIGFLAFVLAILLVNIFLPTFNDLSNKALAFNYLLDSKLVAIYVLTFILTSTLAGFYPALVLSGLSPVSSLYNRTKLSGKNYLQKSLVVVQFSLAGFLIVLSLTVYNQFNFLINKDLGYDDKDLVQVNFGQNLNEEKTAIFKDELLQNASITAVAPKNSGGWFKSAKVNNGKKTLNFSYETVDEAYIPMLKLKLVAGRNFSKDFPSDASTSVLINETFAKEAGWSEPIGQIVDFWHNDNEKYSVVGVVKDYHFSNLSQEIRPQLFSMKPTGFGMANIKIAPKSASESLVHIETTFKSLFPRNSYSYSFKNLENIKAYEKEAKWKQITFISTLLTIFISCIGLFGLALLSAEKRSKEVGIRKAIGASVASIVKLLTKDFLKLTLISLVISLPLAYLAGKEFLQNYPYHEEMKPWIFVVSAIIAISVALLTVSYQAVKTALINPVETLRRE